MGNRTRYLVVAVLLAVGLLAAANPALARAAHKHHVRHKTCHVGSPAHLLMANGEAEILERLETNSPEPPTIVGCAYRSGRIVTLGPWIEGFGTPLGFGPGIDHGTLVLAGSITAYGYGSGSPCSGTEVVDLRDLRTGRLLQSLPTGGLREKIFGGECPTIQTIVGAGRPSDVVVTPHGSAAWIWERYYRPESSIEIFGRTVYTVEAFDKRGVHVLASGEGVAPRSLALAGSTLYWTENGQPRSATLD
jgi:hypothetical protein